jgi:lipid II:glycine glycyltransferase (peptidoglycan interpeptide bridge formation enzyme)
VWDILEWQLEERFGARPTHTLAEIEDVADRLGEAVCCRVAKINGQVVAGVVLFIMGRVVRAQYSAANRCAREVSALDLLFHTVISDAQQNGFRYVDFGSSNTDEGRQLNGGLYRYKTGLGAGSVAHDMYELAL